MAEQVVWVAADGTTIDLTDEAAGYSVLANGTRGLRSVTYDLTTARYAGIDGETVQAIRAEANEPTVGLLVHADDESDFRAKVRGLVQAMRPKAGIGSLTVRSEAGARTLACYCVAGLEGDESTDATLAGSWWKVVLKFYAPDPWWYGDPVTIGFGLAAPSVFLSPTLSFPRMLSASTIQGQQYVDLSGTDAPTFPVWTVTGPGAYLVLMNNTTGRSIRVNMVLGDGQSMVIDTRPGYQSVRRGDLSRTDPDSNLMRLLATDPALWPLVEGVNDVSAMLGAAGQNSRIEAVFQPRYAGI